MKTTKEIQDILIEKWLHIKNGDDIEVIDPEVIAKANDISVIEMDLSSFPWNVSGFVHFENQKFQIAVASKDSENRKRFTLAHELWHFFLHPDILMAEGTYVETNIMFRGGDYSEQEFEANIFAAEYLMPEQQVKELYQKYGVIEILAWFFKVSNLAMAYRIDNLFNK